MNIDRAIDNLEQLERTNMFDRNEDAKSVRIILNDRIEKIEYIKILESKLMFALCPTNHELGKSTIEQFKTIIRDNLDEDTETIRQLLKDCWEKI